MPPQPRRFATDPRLRRSGPKVQSLTVPLLVAATLVAPLSAADPPPPATIVEVRLNEKLTKCENHTAPYDYSEYCFYRRGNATGFSLVLSSEYKSTTHDLKIIATQTFDGVPKKITMDVKNELPIAGWGAFPFPNTGYQEGPNWVQLIGVQIPGDAAIGDYTFEASVEPKGAPDQAVVKAFPKPVVVLFNPWSAQDKDVYDPLENQRKEFVLETEGRIYQTRPINATAERKSAAWSFDQFDQSTVKVTLMQLEGLSAADRSSALKVCRKLVDRVAAKQADGAGGMLIGRWDGNYGDGKLPTAWTRSGEIFTEFSSTSTPVKYGQCWVFAGILTSMGRCLGIPALTQTTFDAGREEKRKDPKEIDEVYKRDPMGKLYFSDPDSDWHWEHHVWCEFRLRHEAQAPTWQSCDGTYDTLPTHAPYGPAPLAKIKAKSGGEFDVQFLTTAFDGDRRRWYYDVALPQKPQDKTVTGWYVTMKKVGGPGWTDITSFYKVPEAEPLPPLPPSGGSDLAIDVFHSLQVTPGTDISFELLLHNGAPWPRHLAISGNVRSQSYDGTAGEELLAETTTIELAGGDTVVLPWTVSGGQTVQFAASRQDVVLTLAVQDLDQPDPDLFGEPAFLLLDRYRTTILPIELELVLDPGGPFSIGDEAQCTLRFVNPLPVPAEEVVMVLSAGDGDLVDGTERLEIPLDPVAPGARAEVAKPVIFNHPGKRMVLGTVVAKGFRASIASVSAEVANPPPTCPADLNGDGRVNGADLGILLAAWGPGCDCECISPDLNGDGMIDGMDLGLFLNAWGLCPN